MRGSKFVFTHFVVENPQNSCWEVFENQKYDDGKNKTVLPKSSECYGRHNVLGSGSTADEAIADAYEKNKVGGWSIEVIK